MPNELKDKFAASAALTISLGSLADDSGRQSALVDNSAARYQDLLVYVQLKMNTTTAPNGGSTCELYLLRGDGDAATEHVTDGAGPGDAALTVVNAPLVGVVRTEDAPAAGDVLYGEFLVHRPGPTWGVAIVNRTGQALADTGGDHWVRYVGLNPEVQ